MSLELMRLKANYYADIVIEGWKSLIWTERYQRSGDFELRTGNIAQTLAWLPLHTCVGIMESNECMIVENHSIEIDKAGQMILVVTGRSFETFFEGRVARPRLYADAVLNNKSDDKSNDWTFQTKHAQDMAVILLKYWSTDQTAIDNSLDLANYSVAGSFTNPDEQYADFVIRPGTIYDRVIEMCQIDNLGIRSSRPRSADGTETGKLQTIVYYGVDRTATVTLSTKAGHFRGGKYFFSDKEYRSIMEGYSFYDKLTITRPNQTADGFGRRVGFLDASDIRPAKTAGVYTAPLNPRVNAALDKAKKVALFEGEVAPDIPYKIGTHYSIGDYLTVLAEYGIAQKMMVSEFTRIVDEQGERQYPTLEQPIS